MMTEVWHLLRLPAMVIKALWIDVLSRQKPGAAQAQGSSRYLLGGAGAILLAALIAGYVVHARSGKRANVPPSQPSNPQLSAGTQVRLSSDPGCASGNAATYPLCSDRQIAEWDIAEARAVQQLTQPYTVDSGEDDDTRRSLFDKAFFECCFTRLKTLREESLRRLGKTGLSLEELETWDRLAGDPKTPPYQYKVNDAQDFAQVLSQLGLLLLHRGQA